MVFYLWAYIVHLSRKHEISFVDPFYIWWFRPKCAYLKCAFSFFVLYSREKKPIKSHGQASRWQYLLTFLNTCIGLQPLRQYKNNCFHSTCCFRSAILHSRNNFWTARNSAENKLWLFHLGRARLAVRNVQNSKKRNLTTWDGVQNMYGLFLANRGCSRHDYMIKMVGHIEITMIFGTVYVWFYILFVYLHWKLSFSDIRSYTIDIYIFRHMFWTVNEHVGRVRLTVQSCKYK